MSVAKNTLVSGSREKSLEIITLRPPPQAGRTSVCDRLSREESSRRRTSAHSSPKPTLRSSPFPRLRCPVNVQPIALFYTVGHLLHRSAGTLRQSNCRSLGDQSQTGYARAAHFRSSHAPFPEKR